MQSPPTCPAWSGRSDVDVVVIGEGGRVGDSGMVFSCPSYNIIAVPTGSTNIPRYRDLI